MEGALVMSQKQVWIWCSDFDNMLTASSNKLSLVLHPSHAKTESIVIWYTVPSYGYMTKNSPHTPITWSNPWLD